jgi:hypothetical protein
MDPSRRTQNTQMDPVRNVMNEALKDYDLLGCNST